MFGFSSGISAIVGAFAAAIFVAGFMAIYDDWVDDPNVRSNERAIVQAENEKHTTEAINEIASAADKARAMRKYCASINRVYDFAKVGCVD